MKIALPAFAAAVALLLPNPVRAASLRCDSELVSDGALKVEVVLKCGEPMAKDSHVEEIRDRRTGLTIYVTVEEWTYNFGPRAFLQTVIFRNGRLVDVRSGDYGR
jgi:hypothetical protein